MYLENRDELPVSECALTMIDLRKRWILEGLVLTSVGMALAGWVTWVGLRYGLTLQARRHAAGHPR